MTPEQFADGWDYRLIDEDDWSEYLDTPVQPTTLPMLVLLNVIAIFDNELNWLMT